MLYLLIYSFIFISTHSQMPLFCQLYDLSSQKCYQCRKGYKLNINLNSCIQQDKYEVQKYRQIQRKESNYILNQIQTQQTHIMPSKQNNLIQRKQRLLTETQNCQVFDVSNKQLCISCKQEFYLDGSTCKKIIKNCQQYNKQTGQCLKCKPSYKLQSNKCIDINCMYFNYNTEGCLNCQSGFSLINQRCIINVNNNCINYLNGICTQCDYGYFLNQNKICTKLPYGCIKYDMLFGKCLQCSSAFYLSSTMGVCQILSLDPYCRKYQNGRCKQCTTRFYLSQILKCTPVSALCKNYSVDGKCTDCYPGYTLNLDNGYCFVAKTPYCKIQKQQKCNQCIQSFYLNQNLQCQAVDPLCKIYNKSNGDCLSCYRGYQLNKSKCIIFIPDTNCKNYDYNSNKCVECLQRYYLKDQNCQLANQACRSYDKLTGFCTDCFAGYKLTNGNCVVNAQQTLLNCRISVNAICIVCANNYFINPVGQCQMANSLCKTFNASNGYCLSCYSGYILSSNGLCQIQKISQNSDPNCKSKLNSSFCLSCYQGYFVKDGKCQAINVLCKTYDPSNGNCLSCYLGYVLNGVKCDMQPIPSTNKNNQVTQSISSSNNNISTSQIRDPNCIRYKAGICVQCSFGYYSNSNKQCLQLDPLCKQNNLTTGQCLSCYDGYVLNATLKKCVIVKPPYLSIPFCQQINPITSLCQKCSYGYFLAPTRTQCKYLSLLCTKYQMQTGQCFQCLYGYFLQDGQCIFPAVGMDWSCVKYNAGFCSKCKQGYQIYNYKCVEMFKAGSF